MVNWNETFKYYKKWLDWEHYPQITRELCYWYQDRFRVYLDEINR